MCIRDRVLALSRISALVDLNFGNALRCAYFGCLSLPFCEVSQKYMRVISRYLGQFLKKGINYAWAEDWTLCRPILLFFRYFRKVFITHSFCKWPLYTLQSAERKSLARFRKTRKRVNRGKTQCWAVLVISKATFTKTAIKWKFDDRLSFKNFSTAIDQSTLKFPIFVSIETF